MPLPSSCVRASLVTPVVAARARLGAARLSAPRPDASLPAPLGGRVFKGRPARGFLARGGTRALSKGAMPVSARAGADRGDWAAGVAASLAVIPSLLAAGPAAAASAPSEIYSLADLDPALAASAVGILTPVLSVVQLLFIFRIILTWYPENEDKMPWVLIVKPTEPLLGPTRKAIPPIGGVDVSPVVWFAVFSFINEILIGPQGIFRMLAEKV